ncbi:MAG TPA: glycosyltransferase family 4 protein [Candidatus Binatia bacterium]|nr:glycosyltransferase family 4 protein [Candidatus Binatia bacterium]
MRVAHLVTGEALSALAARLSAVSRVQRGAVDARIWTVGVHDAEDVAGAGVPVALLARSTAAAAAMLAARLCRERIDVLHTHTPRADLLAAVAGGHVRRASTQAAATGGSAIHRCALRRFDRVYASSRVAEQHLVCGGIRAERLRCVPPPVDAARFAGVYRQRTAPGRSRTGVVALLGPLIASPAALDVLQAFAAARLPAACRLVIAGDGPDERVFAAWRVRLGLESRLHLRPAPADPLPLLRVCDVVVVPPAGTSLPAPALAACAAGVPVVALDAPGIRELIDEGHTGLRPAPGDRDAIAAALERAVGDDDLVARLVRHARRLVERRFALERHAVVLARDYRALAAPASAVRVPLALPLRLGSQPQA